MEVFQDGVFWVCVGRFVGSVYAGVIGSVPVTAEDDLQVVIFLFCISDMCAKEA